MTYLLIRSLIAASIMTDTVKIRAKTLRPAITPGKPLKPATCMVRYAAEVAKVKMHIMIKKQALARNMSFSRVCVPDDNKHTNMN